MKLSDVFEDALILNEIYDTKAPVKAWIKDRLGNLEGEFSIGEVISDLQVRDMIAGLSGRALSI